MTELERNPLAVEVVDLDQLERVGGQAVPPSNGKPSMNGSGPGPRFALTDTGNAERLVHHHGTDLLYCAPWGKWLAWDGRRYAIDTTQEINRRATDTVRKIHLEAAHEPIDSVRAELGKHALRSESESRIRALVSRAESMLSVRPDQLDADPWLFNCANGTIDLRTGNMSPHDRGQRITKCSPVPYDPDARCPTWMRFLARVMSENGRLIGFLQRLCGYALTALTIEQVLVFLWGTGRNGKSVFIILVQHCLGDYAKSTRPETLMVKPGNTIANDIAALVGARTVATVEIDDGARLAESLVKQLTGGDTVTARFLYGEDFNFRPTFKIFMVGNHKPVIRGTDIAIWERILTVPFDVTIPAEERDRQLTEKLQAEASGILAWMVQGCLEWQRIGLSPPPEVRAATDEYRNEMDVLAQFIEDCCELRYDAVTSSNSLYERYTEWCKNTGERQWSQHLFGRRLRERGLEPERIGQVRAWQGIDLRTGG